MKLKFHWEVDDVENQYDNYGCVKTTRLNNLKRGFIILESDPQVRTIFCGGNRGSKRLAFPYVLSTISYTLNKNGIYFYDGIYGLGLTMFFSNRSVQSFDDKVFVAPTDSLRHGVVCTPHKYDGMQFKTLHELVNHVITMWWGTVHSVSYQEWENVTLDNCCDYDWNIYGNAHNNKFESLKQSLINAAIKCGFLRNKTNIVTFLNNDINIIDKPWPTDLNPQII